MSRTKHSYATLAFLVIAIGGFIVTWYFNLQYLMQGGGLGPAEFFAAAFANPLTSAITIDIYLSAIAFSAWVVSDSRHARIKWPWAYILICFALGLVVSLPIYLVMRERARLRHLSS